MISVVIHAGPGLDDYTLHLANAMCGFARVAYSLDVHQLQRYDKAIDSRVTPLVFNRPRRRHVWGLAEMAKLSRAIRAFNPDIFHLQGDGMWEMVLLRMLGRIPLVNTVHDPVKHIDQRNWLNMVTQRDAIVRASAWVVHSERLKSLLLQRFPVDPERVLVHPHGILDYYTRFVTGASVRKKSIVYFGELRLNKGCDILLRAFGAARDQLEGWNLIIAGKGSVLDSAKPLMRRLGSSMDFRPRFIPDLEVAELFSEAGIVALPYRHGSQSGVLAIAAAFGCPVLASRVGGLPDVVQDRKQVFFVEPDNEASLAQGLITLVHNEILRVRLGEALQDHARACWAWQDIAKATETFYRARN